VPVTDVDTTLVLKVVEPIWKTKTETAGRVRGRIERVLAFAKVRGWRTGENPALWRGHLREILPKRSKLRKVKNHPALPYKVLPTFMARLRNKDGITARALEFTILTATRTSEAIGATFDEFDLDAKLWRIPAERMKAEKEHEVPLCDRAVAIIKEVGKTRLSAHVFPGIKRGEPLSNMAMLMMLRDMHAGSLGEVLRAATCGGEKSRPAAHCAQFCAQSASGGSLRRESGRNRT
jgi:integrase